MDGGLKIDIDQSVQVMRSTLGVAVLKIDNGTTCECEKYLELECED